MSLFYFISTFLFLFEKKLVSLQTINLKQLNMKKLIRTIPMVIACMLAIPTQAQLSSNPDKFLGNITTYGQVDYGNTPFYQLWNQITPENESKWHSIQGNNRNSFNWTGCDNAYNYAKNHNFPFKFHTLIWGSQYPSWMDNLSTTDQYDAIEKWMDAVKQRYPDLPMIDVVNEAIVGHAPAPYKAALGNDGITGYDWIIKAFEMAHERWPDAILIYNDFNTFQWQKKEFIELVRTLRDAGAPIDAYGMQSHDLNDINVNTFKNAMTEIHNELKMPMYITEYDIAKADDNVQKQRYQEQIPYMWEADYCAGVTLWGYIYGKTWVENGTSGIIKDGVDRPAMTWLKEYMKTDAAKKAKSPFPNMVKEASVYVKPAAIKVEQGKAVPIDIRARLKTKTIDHIDFYVNNTKYTTLTTAPYTVDYTPAALGKYDLKAIVVATDGTQYERLSGFTVCKARVPYNGGVKLPGTIEAENFDSGDEGLSYHDSDNVDEGDAKSYRSDNGGVDIVQGNGGYAIGYTAAGEWLEYTVDVEEAGNYKYTAYASCGSEGGSGFSLGVIKDGVFTNLCSIQVPQTASNSWDTYKAIEGTFSVPLEKGKQIIRLTIDRPYCNIDKIVIERSSTGIDHVTLDQQTGPIYNLRGQQTDARHKGIVIINGKKVVNK